MAWTAPRTWVSTEVVTASIMNTHVRDNLLETAPAKAVAADRFFVTTGANSIASRLTGFSNVVTLETTASTSFTNLVTTGPATTITTGTRAVILISANLWNNTGGQLALMGYEITGASAVPASDNEALIYESGAVDDQAAMMWGHLRTGLTAGSNTFTAKYRASGGTASFRRRHMAIIPL